MISLLLAAAVATNGAAAAQSPAPDGFNRIKNPARITADTTYYDRREGIVVFKGRVHVDDAEYQMHASKAFLFLSETNSLKRIVATGNVALTNGTRRAYGEKAAYRSENGLVVLHGGEKTPAEVRDEQPGGARTVRGKKIRFWINREQIEVVEADISAPSTGAKSLLPGLMP